MDALDTMYSHSYNFYTGLPALDTKATKATKATKYVFIYGKEAHY